MSVKSVIRHSSSTQLISIRTCKTHARGRKGAEWKITYFTYTTDKDGRRRVSGSGPNGTAAHRIRLRPGASVMAGEQQGEHGL